jgi:hypothetical protein
MNERTTTVYTKINYELVNKWTSERNNEKLDNGKID